MSRSFAYTLSLLTRYEPIYGIFVPFILISHGTYAYSTEKEDKINIVKKYKITRHGFTELMIIDNKGRHFNINNSFWYNKWDSIEDWNNMKENEQIIIKYYGWRIPLLGLFPNVFKSYLSA